ncbi:MAG: TonB-dependent receptor [Balneolales bacterium]
MFPDHAISQKVGIHGKIIADDEYRTPLHGASILLPDLQKGTASNFQGNFSLDNLSEGTYHMSVSFVGYQTLDTLITLPAKDFLVALRPDVTQMADAVVQARAYRSDLNEQAPVSTIAVTDFSLQKIPKFLGEPDLIRIVQNLPGVKTETDFTGGFFVRGGRNDQNLILLDDVPIYNPWHLFGVFSAFNTEALSSVELNKGIFPARYGSRLSSVLNIELQEGNTRRGAGFLNMSILSSTFSYGKPINQNTSYLLALRRTYMDPIFWITNPIFSDNTYKVRNGYHFTDASFKIVHHLNNRLKLDAHIFYGADILRSSYDNRSGFSDSSLRLGWRNIAASLRLQQRFGALRLTNHVYTSYYNARNSELSEWKARGGGSLGDDEYNTIVEDTEEQLFNQQFLDLAYRIDARLQINQPISINGGVELIRHGFNDQSTFTHQNYGYQGEARPDYSDDDISLIRQQQKGNSLRVNSGEYSAYGNFNFNYGWFTFYPGMRIQHYSQGDYLHLLPRVNLSLKPHKKVTLSAGYGRFAQYLHVLGIELTRMPTDRWFWADEDTEPSTSEMFTAGFQIQIDDGQQVSMEAYHKSLKNLRAFAPIERSRSLDFSELPLFSSGTIKGNGQAYGIEWFYKKTRGNITGWAGYTLSWNKNQFDDLNLGLPFYTRSDRRHDIQMFSTYSLTDNWDFGMMFNYKSGQPITFATGAYSVDRDPLAIGDHGRAGPFIYLQQNNYRLPDYHRLDLSVTLKNRKIFKRPAEFSLNVINIYNRLNVLTVNTETIITELPNGGMRVQPNNRYITQLPIIPMFSVRIALGADAL